MSTGTGPPPPAAAGFRMMLRLEIVPGCDADFEATWRAVAAEVSQGSECLRQWLLRVPAEPGVYFIVSDWADAAAFQRFRESPGHDGHASRLKPFQRSMTVTLTEIAAGVEPPMAAETPL